MLKGIIQISLLAIMLSAVISMPDHPDALSLANFFHFPLEVPLLALSLILVPRQWLKWLALLSVISVGTLLFLKLADMGTQAAFQRPFNPYLDIKMIGDAWNVLSRSIGVGAGALSLVIGILSFAALLLLFNWACRFPLSLQLKPFGQVSMSMLLLCAGAGVLIKTRADASPSFVVEARALPYLVQRIELIGRSVTDMREFESEIAKPDPVASHRNLMTRLAGQDVILIFVESYGRSAVEDARYASETSARFEAMSTGFKSAGYQVASRWVTSPTVGGMSWLAHGTLLSGLWIDSQARYDRLMTSGRKSLNRLFKEAGWQTVAAMPAITLDWPESAYFGYDTIFAAKDLGYRGKPFNWITMPDQYTLSAIQRLARDPQPRPNVMIETALISSHAPWTPVAQMLDWAAVGDGGVFDSQANSGQSPAYVWADTDRIRDHYIRTISYSLEAVSSYITSFGGDAIFIVIGDHQPAAVITGPAASRDVPLHIITRNKEVADSFAQHGFGAGLRPGNASSLRMDELRSLFTDIFSGPL